MSGNAFLFCFSRYGPNMRGKLIVTQKAHLPVNPLSGTFVKVKVRWRVSGRMWCRQTAKHSGGEHLANAAYHHLRRATGASWDRSLSSSSVATSSHLSKSFILFIHLLFEKLTHTHTGPYSLKECEIGHPSLSEIPPKG